MVQRILAWAQRNERHLGALVFFFGFVTDIVALVLLDISIVVTLFTSHLILAGLCIFLGHALTPWREAKSVWKRSVMVVLPLAAQYLLGGLFSWFLIFYAKSSVIEASWPFLLLLAAVFIGNEWFRKYKDRLSFIAVLYFFALYAYAIFALPLFIGSIGPGVFLGSTVLALGVFSLYLILVWSSGRQRFRQSFARIIGSVATMTALVVASYFAGVIPPIPLALSDSGIYHDLTRVGGNYVVSGGSSGPWWDPRPDVVPLQPGSPLYAFSAVRAPTTFGAVVVHRWQQYDEQSRAWVTRSRIAFPITGGRSEGYRGYSTISNTTTGEWRVRVETENGQVIGQMRFRVERGAPALHQEIK